MSTPTEILKPVDITFDVPGQGEKSLVLVWNGKAAILAERCGFDVMAFGRGERVVTNAFAALWGMVAHQLEPMTFDEFVEACGGFAIEDTIVPIKQAMMNAASEKKRPTPARSAAGGKKGQTSSDG